MSPTPRFAPRPHPGDFFAGLALPLRALRLVLSSRRLFLLSLLSALVTLAVLVLLAWGVWSASGWLLSWAMSPPGAGWREALWQLARGVLFAGLFAVGALTVPLLALTPLQDPLSEATEALCGGFTPPPFTLARFLRGLAVALRHTLGRVGLLLLGQALLFPLNFVPGAGNVLWGVLATLWSIQWVAAEHLGTPMARHLYRFRDVRAPLRARRALGLGFGAAVYVLLWVPVLNALLLPLATVGGTLLYRGLREAGTLPPPPGE